MLSPTSPTARASEAGVTLTVQREDEDLALQADRVLLAARADAKHGNSRPRGARRFHCGEWWHRGRRADAHDSTEHLCRR